MAWNIQYPYVVPTVSAQRYRFFEGVHRGSKVIRRALGNYEIEFILHVPSQLLYSGSPNVRTHFLPNLWPNISPFISPLEHSRHRGRDKLSGHSAFHPSTIPILCSHFFERCLKQEIFLSSTRIVLPFARSILLSF